MYEKELFVARLAVQKASVLVRAVSEVLVANRAASTITKLDKSPVTVGDFSAQAIIINAIKHSFPTDEVVGEEDSADLQENPAVGAKVLQEITQNNVHFDKEYQYDGATRELLGPQLDSLHQIDAVIDQGNSSGGPKGRFWALDPIDGTKGFLRGDQYAVCLALIVDGIVQLGVIGCPNLPDDLRSPSYKGGLFFAVRGHGAFYSKLFNQQITRDYLAQSQRISMRNNLGSTSDVIVCEGVEKSHSSHDDQLKIKQLLKIPVDQTLNLDSQVKYCALAKGLADVYLRLPVDYSYREKIWDHAAGNVLITESNGVVSDMQGNPLDFTTGRTLNSHGIIAANKQFHPQIISAVKAAIPRK